jgi:hypothetical protein
MDLALAAAPIIVNSHRVTTGTLRSYAGGQIGARQDSLVVDRNGDRPKRRMWVAVIVRFVNRRENRSAQSATLAVGRRTERPRLNAAEDLIQTRNTGAGGPMVPSWRISQLSGDCQI